MHFFTNVSKSRQPASTAIRIASFAAFLSWMIISQSADAGLIEAAKDASCHSSSVKEKANAVSDQPPVNDTATNKIQAVTLFLTHTRHLMSATSNLYAKPMDLSAVLGSKDLGFTSSEITMALINAHVYARLKISSDDSDNHVSLCCGENEVISLADMHSMLLSPLKSYCRGDIDQFQAFNPEDDVLFLPFSSPLTNDERRTTSQSTTPTFAATFVAANHTIGNASHTQVSRRATNGVESSDSDEYDEDNGEDSSDNKSSDDRATGDRRPLGAEVDSFDPLMASVALLIFGAIALVVNTAPRRSVLTTQL